MTTHPTFWMVSDGKGGMVLSENPPHQQSLFDNFGDDFSIIAILFSTAMILMTVIVIVGVLHQLCVHAVATITGSAIETSEDKEPLLSPSPKGGELLERHVVPDSEREGETLNIFIGDILRERPISFSPRQIEELIGNPQNILGSGGHGIVYKGMGFFDGPVAVKVLKNNLDKITHKQFMEEVGTIGRTYHANLVRIYGFCSHTTTKAIVYEYMAKGSLDKVLFGKNEWVEWEKLHQIAIGTAKGIAYLHEGFPQRIIHYDIKPGNVLLDANFNPKVADFGLAKLKLCSTEGSNTVIGCRGTPGYQAPELGNPYPVTDKCDVYSFGKMLFEIVARRKNYDPDKDNNPEWLTEWAWDLFTKGELPDLLGVCNIEEKNKTKAERMLMIGLWCIQHLPEARPTMSDVVKMLEGVMEIAPPPCPFENSKSGPSAKPIYMAYGKSKTESNCSSSSRREPNASSSKATGEIEDELDE